MCYFLIKKGFSWKVRKRKNLFCRDFEKVKVAVCSSQSERGFFSNLLFGVRRDSESQASVRVQLIWGPQVAPFVEKGFRVKQRSREFGGKVKEKKFKIYNAVIRRAARKVGALRLVISYKVGLIKLGGEKSLIKCGGKKLGSGGYKDNNRSNK